MSDTMVKEKEKLQQIISHFEISDKEYDFQKISIGHINQTYKVIGKEASYLLQQINTSIFQEPEILMGNIYKVSHYLQAQDYNYGILKAFPTKNATLTYKDENNKVWRLMNFFENTYSIDKVSEMEQAFQGGKMFGHFINALKNIKPHDLGYSIPNFHNGKLRWQQFEQAIQENRAGRLNGVKSLISDIKLECTTFFEVNELLNKKQIPTRIMHCDTKINNLLFDKIKNTPIAVIDWDTIMPATVLSDFGDMVRTFANSADEEETDLSKVQLDYELFGNMTRGFLSEVKNVISEVEKKQLINGAIWIVYMQVLRFLTDFLNGDIYYKIVYNKQNLDRTLNQFQFLKELKSFKKDMEGLILSM